MKTTVFVKKPLTPPKGKKPTYDWERITKGIPMVFENTTLREISSCAYAAARRLGRRFSLRTVTVGKRTDVEVHLRSSTR